MDRRREKCRQKTIYKCSELINTERINRKNIGDLSGEEWGV